MVEFHKQSDNTVSGKSAETDSHPLLSTKDWADFNQTIAKNKPAAGDNGVIEFNNPYKSDTKIAKPEAKSSNEDYTPYNKKVESEKPGGKEFEKKYVPNPTAEGGKFDGSKPDIAADGGLKKPYGEGGITDSIGKPNVAVDGGPKDKFGKPNQAADGGLKDSVDKPNPGADGGLKETVGKPNSAVDGELKDSEGKHEPAADGGLKDSLGKPNTPVDGGLKDSADKQNPAADGGLKDNHKPEGLKDGGEKQNFNPPADAGRDNPSDNDGSDEVYKSIKDQSAQATGVREDFGNVTIASAQPLQQPWTVNGDGTVTRGTTRSVPVKS